VTTGYGAQGTAGPVRRCPHCGSTTFITDAEVTLVADFAHLRIFTGPWQKTGRFPWNTQPVQTDVKRCDVCCGCGAVVFKVDDPQGLFQAHQAAMRKG
jgi:hypothetical protein